MAKITYSPEEIKALSEKIHNHYCVELEGLIKSLEQDIDRCSSLDMPLDFQEKFSQEKDTLIKSLNSFDAYASQLYELYEQLISIMPPPPTIFIK